MVLRQLVKIKNGYFIISRFYGKIKTINNYKLMSQRLIIASLLFASALGLSGYALVNHNRHRQPTSTPETATTTANQQKAELIFYYGDTCPHCHIVDNYIKNNRISQKLNITNKEVYNNQDNADELRAKAKLCGIPDNALGVPLLWNGRDCLVGDQPIIDFLNDQIN